MQALLSSSVSWAHLTPFAGGQELLRVLSRRQHRNMPLVELEATKLSSSQFPAVFHIRDCAGRGLVDVVQAPAGKLVQLVKRRR